MDNQHARRRLYEVMNNDDLSLVEKQRQALAIGREYLGVENGHIQRHDHDDGTHEVVASTDSSSGDSTVPEGRTLDRTTTYCRRTVESGSPVALSHASEQGWADDPAYREHGFECYLGTTLFVEGEVYGTICFVSRDVREASFEASETAFVELIARLLGREMEATRHERELTASAQALERTEDKYESLLRTAPDATLLVETTMGDIVEANDAAAELTGYDRETLLEMVVADLYPPGDRGTYEAEFSQFVEAEDPRSCFEDGTPLYVRRADGTDVPVEVSASVVELGGRDYLQAIVRDISDRRERERERRVRSRAIEEASVGVTVADATDDDLPLVYANREFERITRYDKGDAIGRNCRFLQGPETDEVAVEELREGLAAREPATTELVNYRADGTPFWNELTLAPVTGEGGDEVTHFVGFQRDVTGRKRRERLIAVLNRVLRHNLRNDMNIVSGYADILADRTDGEAAELARRIEQTAADLTTLSEKARNLEGAMREAAPPDVRDVVVDVESVAADLRAAYPDADVTVQGPASCPAVATDRLRLALHELGENAIEHGGSTVTYRVEQAADGGVTVRIEDTGPGLGSSERQVLEAGQETPLEHGQGLGLWLVNWVVTGVGGAVTVDVDDGTTVTVALPPSSDDDGTSHTDSHRQAAISTHAD